MASRSLGMLTLDLVAKIGGFVDGLDKAGRTADQKAKDIERSLQRIVVAGTAVGTALGDALSAGIQSAVRAFPELLEQVASFQDLAEKTGASAEGLASLAVSAKVSGVSMDDIANASVRLTKNLEDVDKKGNATAAALKAIGISISDFKKLAPDEQFDLVATRLNDFADGAGKTAVAVDLLGKAGANLLPFFADFAQAGGRQKILTAEQIKQADELLDNIARSKAQIGLYAAAISTQAIPAIAAFTGVLKEAVGEAYGLDRAAASLGRSTAFATFAEDAGRQLAKILDYIATTKREFSALIDFITFSAKAAGQAATFDFSGAAATGQEFRDRYGLDELGRKVQVDSGKDAARTFVQSYNDELGKAKRSAFAVVDPRRVDLSANGTAKDPRATLAYGGAPTGGGGAKDDPTKKLLDNQLKELSNFIDAEKDLMSSRQKFLDLFNSQGIVSVKDYYDQQRAILEEATQNQVKAYDQQIEALRKYQASSTKATDRTEAEGKINDLIAKQAKLQRDSGASAIEMGIKQEQAIKAYRAQLDEVNAKILELNGSLGAAAAIRFDASNKQLRALAEASGDVASVEQIDRLRQYSIAQADINKLQQDFSLIQGDLQIAEERITIARERGTMGEIESLKASGEARKAAVALLERQLAAYESINAALRTPEQTQAIERLKVQLEGLQATVDPLADRFNTLFENSLGDAFGDFINGTKSAKDAFKDFTTSVTNEIGQLVGKQLAKQLFSSIFDSSGSSGSASGFNIGGFFASIFGGGRAAGGPVLPNTLYRVNERGPEMFEAANGNQFLMTGSTGGRVHPNGSGGGLTQNISFPVQGRVDRRTVDQAAAELRRQTNAAAVRFG